MNGSRMVRVMLVGLALAACGGRVEEEGEQGGDEDGLPGDPKDKKGEQGGSGSGSTGAGGSAGTKGGVLCPVAPARPDYAYCYQSFAAPCLTATDPGLPALLGNAPPVTSGPWEGADAQCNHLCCYAP